MIRILFFTAALHAPVLAFAASPSAPFSDQVVPAGPPNSIACDIGPTYNGSIPAAAQQAGFTHCVFNFDLTQSQQWTDQRGTHQWSNLSTWLTCSNDFSSSSLLWYGQPDHTSCDSNHVAVVNDGGTQVLAISYLLSDAANHSGGIVFHSAICCASGTTGTAGTTFPVGYYLEQVIRRSTNDMCNGCLTWGTSTWAADAATNPCFLVADMDESWGAPTSTINTGLAEWNAGCTGSSNYNFIGGNLPSKPPNPTTSYNTYGFQWTTDGVAYMNICDYYQTGVANGLQGGFYSCMGPSNVVSPMTALFNHPIDQTLNVGPQGGSFSVTSNYTYYLQRVTFWSCSNWRSGSCYVKPVPNGP